MPTALEKDIYRVIAYFSYFGYPVTFFEIWKWQWHPVEDHTLHDVMRGLEMPWIKKNVQMCNGFYGIKSEKFGSVRDQVNMRHDRFLNAVEKYQKLHHLLRYLVRLPFVTGVAICNSLAVHHTEQRSDIDLFVVTKHGRVWTSRLLAVLPLMFLKQRPGEARKNPVDISFYVSEESLNLHALKVGEQDPYMTWWVNSLIPVYGREDVFEQFTRHNAWAKVEMPNARLPKWSKGRNIRFKMPEVFVNDQVAEYLQRKKMPYELLSSAEEGTNVVIGPDMLKFHKNDRRKEIADYVERVLAESGVVYE